MTQFSRSAQSIEKEINRYRLQYVAMINQEMSPVRLKFLTSLPGQEMLYLKKEAEAIDFISQTPEPSDLSNWPLIEAEIGVTAPTAFQVASIYINLAFQLQQVAAATENIRLSGVANVEAATTKQEVDIAYENFRAALAVFLSSQGF